MDKLCIFGSSGFIGSNYCKMFPEQVIKMSREMETSLTPNLLWLRSTTDNYNVLDNVHLDIDTNLSLFVESLDQNRKLFGNSLVFNLISTWFVYGSPEMLPVREDSKCTPNGFYSITSLAREHLLVSYCQTFGLSYRIMRLGNVIGIGDKKISLKKNALQYFIREIVNNRPVNLYWPDRTIRDYIHVDDVCNAISLILSQERTKNGVYNIGNGVPIKFGDCVEYVVNKTGNDECVKHVERSEFHKVVQTNVMYLDNSRIQYLGYRPTKTIWKILDELIDYYKREKDE
jgi:nucleoside-diphosphate-sugar epimerase